MISIVTASVVAAFSIAVAYAVQGQLGIQAAGLGVGVAVVMCGVCAYLEGLTRHLKGQAIVAGMLGGVAASFALMALAMVLTSRLWRPGLEASALTALATYLGYRFVATYQLSALSCSRPPRTARVGSATDGGAGGSV